MFALTIEQRNVRVRFKSVLKGGTPEGSVAFLTGEADREKRFRVNVQAAD